MSSLRFPSDSPGYHRFPSSRHLKMNKCKFRPYNRQYNDSDSKTSWLKTWSELKLIAKEFRINMSLEFIQLNYLLSKVCWSSWMVVRRTWNCFLRSSNWRSVKKKKKDQSKYCKMYDGVPLQNHQEIPHSLTLSSTFSLMCESCWSSLSKASSCLQK